MLIVNRKPIDVSRVTTKTANDTTQVELKMKNSIHLATARKNSYKNMIGASRCVFSFFFFNWHNFRMSTENLFAINKTEREEEETQNVGIFIEEKITIRKRNRIFLWKQATKVE